MDKNKITIIGNTDNRLSIVFGKDALLRIIEKDLQQTLAEEIDGRTYNLQGFYSMKEGDIDFVNVIFTFEANNAKA